MEEVKIRKATIDDIDILQKIGRETFFETFAIFNTEENMKTYLNNEFSLDKLSLELNDKNSDIHFAELNDMLCSIDKCNF